MQLAAPQAAAAAVTSGPTHTAPCAPKVLLKLLRLGLMCGHWTIRPLAKHTSTKGSRMSMGITEPRDFLRIDRLRADLGVKCLVHALGGVQQAAEHAGAGQSALTAGWLGNRA